MRLINPGFCLGITCFVALTLGCPPVQAEPAPESQVDQVFRFLNHQVINKKLILQNNPCQNGIAGTDIQCDFERTIIYANLVRSEQAIKYNQIFSVRQTNRLPQPDGTFREENKDRIGVSACELRLLKSENAPKALYGFCQGIANSIVDVMGGAQSVQMQVSGNQLIQTSATVGVDDCFANNASGYRLCTAESRIVLETVNAKLQRKTLHTGYHVSNALTGERVPAGEPEEYLDSEL